MNYLVSITLILTIVKIYSAGQGCSKEERRNVQEWHQYKHCFKQSFHPSEDGDREQIFKANVKKVQLLNAKHPNAKFGMNKFAHLKVEEYRTRYLGSKIVQRGTHVFSSETFSPVDWRQKGAVTRVKNQKNCGSCYAFSGIGAVESHYAINKNHTILLSEQQIVDCSAEYGNNGCNGGLMESVFNYVRDMGSMRKDDYEYMAKQSVCKYNESAPLVNIRGYEAINPGNETQLTEVIRFIGPVSVAIDAGQESFMFFQEGIYSDEECSSTDLNHGVLVVGVTNKYYIVKNSWGKAWGMDGYINIARNKGNLCGIASDATYPVF